jgi:hypothetical protein
LTPHGKKAELLAMYRLIIDPAFDYKNETKTTQKPKETLFAPFSFFLFFFVTSFFPRLVSFLFS